MGVTNEEHVIADRERMSRQSSGLAVVISVAVAFFVR